MPISINTAITFGLGSIAGYFCRILLEHWLAKSRTKEERKVREFNEAANKFRSRILVELEGLYPVTQHWDTNTFHRFKQSITKIESAGAEFRYFIRDSDEFDDAVNKYCKICREITSDRCAAWAMYPTMREEGEIGPREEFANCVEILLSFAKAQ